MILRSIIVFCLTVLTIAGYGQYKDAGMWASGQLEYAFNKKTEFSFSPEIRLNENYTRWRNIFSDVSVSYKLQKGLSAEFTYRFGYRNNVVDGISYRQRLQFGLGYKIKWRDFSFSWLSRYQASVVAAGSDRDADFITNWRNKFSVRFDGVKKYEFSSAFEFFHGQAEGNVLYWQDWRWTGAVERKINKRNYIGVGYLIQKDLTAAIPAYDFVTTLNYKYVLIKKEANDQSTPLN